MPTLSKRTTKSRRKALRTKKRKVARARKANLASGRAKTKAKAKAHRAEIRALKPRRKIVEMGDPKPPALPGGGITREEALAFVAQAGSFAPQVVAAEDELGLLHCPACHTMRPAADFDGVALSMDPQAPPPACRACREQGLSPVPIVPGMDPRLAYILARRAEGAAYAAIAGEVGLSIAQVRAIAGGQVLEGQASRRAFALALRQVGVDPIALARKGAELMQAKKTVFYLGEPIADVEDNTTQATTWRHMTKLADLEPPKQRVSTTRSIKVTTNLDEAHPEDRSGEITAKITRREATA
jgi:hypothetical protein